MKKIYLIAGPTASGKSAYAIKLAKDKHGEIINADAMQVYKELQVLSARPAEREMQNIPHHLYGHVSVRERFSTGRWLKQAEDKIIDVLARDKTPILVGGTGLYFKALTDGLAQIPKISDEAKKAAQNILDKQGIDALRLRAFELDTTATNKVLGDDPQRLLRIVSVALGSQKPLSEWQKNTRPALPKDIWKGLVILPKRDVLYQRINTRFGDMLKTGGLLEAKRIHKMDLPDDLPAMRAIGLKELLSHIRGEIDLDTAIEIAQRQTRRFAKRQYTWIRGNMKNWRWLEPDDYISSEDLS